MRTERIPLDVPTECEEVPIGLHKEGLVTALVQMTEPDRFVRGSPSLGMCQGQPSHERREIAVMTGMEYEVPMVRHDAVRKDTHLHSIPRLHEYLLEGHVVELRAEEPLAVVRPIEHMVHMPANVDTRRFCHTRKHSHEMNTVTKTTTKTVPGTVFCG